MPAEAELRTERLLLRPLVDSDLDAYHLVMSQDAVGEQLPRGRGCTIDETRALLQFWLEHWRDHGFGPWAVIDNDSGSLVGHCGLRRLDESGETELLYALGAEYWGHGFATEAARASTAWAFTSLGLDELVGFVKPANVRSQAVMRACGFAQVDRVHQWGLDLHKFRRGSKESS